MSSSFISALVFFATLAITFGVAIWARLRMQADSEEDLAGRSLNRWLVGLSAGTTGNSGFIVTGAVGLGYAGGVQWLLLPLAWLLGDLIFWSFFPDRLNRLARRAEATTLSEVLTFDLTGNAAKVISLIVSVLLVVFLTTYTSAQWMAGKKFLGGVFELSEASALLAFGITIVAYSSIGGFRGSVYVDVLQAAIRLIGTFAALTAVIWFAASDPTLFWNNLNSVGPDFFNPFPGGIIAALGLVGGYACAAVGFGLGQPQIVSRYMAGASPEETKAARWIYIGFLQFTWLAMTVFGILLRGVMPEISDPETGLSVFFQTYMGPIITGIIFADVFATIASTSNGLLVAISQTLRRDLIGPLMGRPIVSLWAGTAITLVIGLISVALSFSLKGNVYSVAIGAIAKIGAGLAGPMIIKSLAWRHTGTSLLVSILAGIASAYIWSGLGYDAGFNEAGVGIVVGLIANFAIVAVSGSYTEENR